MRFASTGDIHLTDGERSARTVAVMEFVIDDAAALGATLLILGGDFAGTTVPHRATPSEKHLLAGLVQRAIAKGMQVVMHRGNHDFLLDYDLFTYMGATYFTQPGLLTLDNVTLLAAPYPFKHQWLTERVASIADQNALATREYLTELHRLVGVARAGKDVPLVLDGHWNVVGAQTGGGEVLSGHEVELTEEDVLALGCDIVLVHHIHKAQDLGGGQIHFAGSPVAQSWGEQADRKCYLLVDTDAGTVERRYTPAPILWTLEARYDDGTWQVAWPLDRAFLPGSECRLHYAYPEEVAATIDIAPVEAELRAAGVVMIQRDPQVIPTTRVRSELVARAQSVHEKLDAWCAVQDPELAAEVPAQLHARLTLLETDTEIIT